MDELNRKTGAESLKTDEGSPELKTGDKELVGIKRQLVRHAGSQRWRVPHI